MASKEFSARSGRYSGKKSLLELFAPDPADYVKSKSITTNELASNGLLFETNGYSTELAATTIIYNGTNREYPNIHSGGAPYSGYSRAYNSNNTQQLTEKSYPKALPDQIKRALEWSENDDLLVDLIRLKLDFTISGFSLKIKPPVGSGATEDSTDLIPARQQVELIERKLRIRKIANDLLRDWFVTDSMILYWKVEKEGEQSSLSPDDLTSEFDTSPLGDNDSVIPGLVDVCALNPADVIWDNSLGVDHLRIKVPIELEKRIEQAVDYTSGKIKEQGLYDELLKSGVPESWIASVVKAKRENQTPYVDLDNNEGDHWIIITRERKHYGLAKPSMYSIFMSLEIRRILSEGDASIAILMKHLILLVQQGESITGGQMAGSKANWITKEVADELLNRLKDASHSMRMVVDHTVKFSWVHPPAELFAQDKYINPEQRIFNWAGVTQAVMTGEGATYGGGFIGIKKLVANLASARREISDLFVEFFDHPTINPATKVPEGHLIRPSFDENVLKEPAQLLNEIRYLYDKNVIDPETILRELGRDPDAIRALKQLAIKEVVDKETWLGFVDILKKRGIYIEESVSSNEEESPNAPGRPANPENQVNPESRMQSPIAQPK